MEAPLFPAFLTLAGRRCLVVGIGAEAERKAALMLRCGATVIACASLGDAPPSLDGIALAIAAGASGADAAALSEACQRRGIPVNVADEPHLCSFLMPAIIDRAPVTVAISTGGRSPMLAVLLREALDRLLPARLGALAELAGRFRPVVRGAIGDAAARRRFWHGVLTGPVAALVLAGRDRVARTALRDALSPLGARMRLVVDGGEPHGVDGGIALRRRQTGVAEQLLDGAEIAAARQEMRREAVAQRMRGRAFR